MKRSWLLLGGFVLSLVLTIHGVRRNEIFAETSHSPRKEWAGLFRTAALIGTTYVEEVPVSKLYEGAMNGMLKSLDPYSQFLDAKSYRELRDDTQGRFAGLGFEISVKGGTLHVIAPLDETPASRAGIRPGDIIARIDGQPSKDLALGEAVKRLRGEPGTTVSLSLVREEAGAAQSFDRTLTREIIHVKGVREAKLIESGIGYVRIAEFQEQTPSDLDQALALLASQGATKIILDLRNNPGGLLESAIDAASRFIPKGELIVSTRGRQAGKDRRFLSDFTGERFAGRLAILINRGSASGSEILSAALKDHERARLFGSKTYGKGCVQTLTGLTDGSAVRITTSYYYTPRGARIHEIGVAPDEESPDDPTGKSDPPLTAALGWLRSA